MAVPKSGPMTLWQYQEVSYLCVKLSGRHPSSAQWAAIASDLMYEPVGGRYVQEFSGKSLVITADPCTLYAPYNALHGKQLPGAEPGALYNGVAGFGWPVPICNADEAYTEGPNGIQRGGVCPPLHEKGHSLSRLIGGQVPLHDQKDFSTAAARIRWWSSAPNNDEKFADAYAAWCLWRGGDQTGRVPPAFLTAEYKPVRDCLDNIARTYLWWK